MPDQRPLPPLDDLLALIEASLRNAIALLGDAKTLLASGSAPRAHALASLALEEIGKSYLCVLALAPIPEPMIIYGMKNKGDFWAAWREHTDKLGWALGFLGLLLRDSGPAAHAIARIHNAAQSGHLRNLFHPAFISRVCSTWIALASWPARQGQQRSLRRMRQVLSWAFARSPGERSRACAQLAAFCDSGMFLPLYGIFACVLP